MSGWRNRAGLPWAAATRPNPARRTSRNAPAATLEIQRTAHVSFLADDAEMRYNSRQRTTCSLPSKGKQRTNTMPAFKEGDRVRIASRPLTHADAKTGLYYG